MGDRDDLQTAELCLMSSKLTKEILISLAIFGFGFASIIVLTLRLEASKPPIPAGYEDSDLMVEGGRLRGYSFGAEGLVADWYWMRALNYLGTKMVDAGFNPGMQDLRPLNPRLLYPMLDNASTLDPQFMTVYTYGATVLPDIDPQKAIALLEKGIGNNPGKWRLYQFLGYIYWEQKDYQKAAEIYERGAQLPGAPNFMSMMASNMRSQGGTREMARQIYTQVLNEAQDDETRIFARARLLGLDSLDEQDVIAEALTTFKKENNRCVTSWREFAGWLRTSHVRGLEKLRVNKNMEPVDPSDTPYLLDTSDCTVHHDRNNSKVAID